MTQPESRRPYIRFNIAPDSVTNTVRLFAVVYVVQAGIGIALGFAYAVWLLY